MPYRVLCKRFLEQPAGCSKNRLHKTRYGILADLAELVHDTDENGEDQTYTRQWVIWHLIEHDLHHGGELSFTLGMHGLTGITI